MTHAEAGGFAPIDDREPSAGSADPVRPLVRLLLAAARTMEAAHPAAASRLTNEAALDALARELMGAADGQGTGTRTAVMALRDLVWRVDTARVLIEPRLAAAGCADLADLLATDDIHALLRDLA